MLGAQFDFTAQIGEVSAKLDKIANALESQQVYRGHPARTQESLTPIATFTNPSQITAIGGPPPGTMVWEVERISFGLNAGGSVTVAGTMIVFLGPVEIARTTTVPNFLTFRGYQCLVTPQDTLGVAWVGGTLAAGSAMLVDVSALEYPILGSVEVPA